MTFQPPEPFTLHPRRSPLTTPWEPIYADIRDDRWVLGIEIREPHTNSRGGLHGGLIAALADNAMGLSCGVVLAALQIPSRGLVTVSLSLDYLGAANLGQWLTFDTDFIKPGKSLCFAGATVRADDKPVARAHATFKVAGV
ncbi:PaaI family thioesterase [Caulobacter henricii]|uniref:Thioesterase n=1 Tax=Caulobacter henricii TaxID=69395 RepID=A0A0P0P4R2_9CAUL|nr:PaaI family thioesterase [Caulobacter henricii]ALL15397.1 thioesterase [Caulobacter henricii]